MYGPFGPATSAILSIQQCQMWQDSSLTFTCLCILCHVLFCGEPQNCSHMLDSRNALQIADGKQHCATATKASQFLFLIHAIHVSLESCAFDELPFMRHLDALTNILIIWHRSNATAVRFQSETRTLRFVNMVKRKLESGQRTNDVHSRHQQLLHGI